MDKQQIISEHMSSLGKKGRGLAKVRGNKQYYQHLVRIREAKRKTKAIEDTIKNKQAPS